MKVIRVIITFLLLFILTAFIPLSTIAYTSSKTFGYIANEPVDAIEVVLNKPDIKYDWSKFRSLSNIIPIRYDIAIEAYAYRSHYNPNIAVIVTLQSLKEPKGKDKYFTIMVMGLRRYVKILNTTIKPTPVVLTVIDINLLKQAAEKLGWNVTVYTIKDLVEFEVEFFVKIKDGVSILTSEDIEEAPLFIPSNESKAVVLEKRLDNATIKLCLINLPIAPGKWKIRIHQVVSGDFQQVRYKYIYEIYNLINSLGLVLPMGLPLPVKVITVRFEDLVNALRFELEWFRDIGIIKNLTDDDIEKIISTASTSFYGWNERLVYYNKTWLPYHIVVRKFNGTLLDYTPIPKVDVDELPGSPPLVIKEKVDPMKIMMALLISLLIAFIAHILLKTTMRK